jgi:hypothetical protein
MTSLVGSVIINKKLPSKTRFLGSATKFLGDLVTKPGPTIAEAIANDRKAVALMRAGTGMTRKQAVMRVAPSLAEGFYKGGGKDLMVNTGGLVGSVAGGSGGVPGTLAGDWLGARMARKGLDDIEALGKAMKIRNNPNFQRLPLRQRLSIVQRRAKGFAKGNHTNELLPDTVGWGIGNGSAMGLSAIGVGVPLKGAAVAMGTADDAVGAIRTGSRFQRRFQNPLRSTQATGVSAVRRLKRKYNVRRGLNRERVMVDSVNDSLSRRLPDIPPGIDFSSRLFLIDFRQ